MNTVCWHEYQPPVFRFDIDLFFFKIFQARLRSVANIQEETEESEKRSGLDFLGIKTKQTK